MRWSRELRRAEMVARRRIRAISSLMAATWAPSTPFAGLVAGGAVDILAFGANPGRLRMLVHVPDPPPRPGAPLIVLLHGCGQDAVQFAAAAGWIALADRLRLPLLLPEQAAPNNRRRCFNWFRPQDTARDGGEAASIRAMVADATTRFATDPTRVFVAGLSAGGAMAAALLAAFPDVFAAGAVVAGLPVGAARGPAQALLRMARAEPMPPPEQLAARARAAAPAGFTGPWPRLSVWTSTDDPVVDPANATLLAAQWAALHGASEHAHGLASKPRRWDGQDKPAVELWTIPGLGHGFPIDAAVPGSRVTPTTPDLGLAATEQIAAFWGLDG